MVPVGQFPASLGKRIKFDATGFQFGFFGNLGDFGNFPITDKKAPGFLLGLFSNELPAQS
jgi:hypothetical protein